MDIVGGGMEHRPARKCSEAALDVFAASAHVTHPQDFRHLLQKQNSVSNFM